MRISRWQWKPPPGYGRQPEIDTLKLIPKLIVSPAVTMREIGEERRVPAGLTAVSLWALLSLASAAIFVLSGGVSQQQFPELAPEVFQSMQTGVKVFVLLFAVLGPFIWWLGLSSLMHLATGLFNGQGSFPGTIAVIGLACVPWVVWSLADIALQALQMLPVVQGNAAVVLRALSLLLFAAILLWHIALVVIGARYARSTSYGASAGSCALSFLGCGMAIALLIVTLVLLVVALSGVPGG